MPPASRQLRDKLDQVLEPVHAEELLSLMPPDWTQLATKTDLAVLGTELRGEMAELRAELRGEMAELRAGLRGEMAELGAGLRGELYGFRGEVRGEFAAVRSEMAAQKGEILTTLHIELRKQTYFFIGTLISLAGMVIGAQALL